MFAKADRYSERGWLEMVKMTIKQLERDSNMKKIILCQSSPRHRYPLVGGPHVAMAGRATSSLGEIDPL